MIKFTKTELQVLHEAVESELSGRQPGHFAWRNTSNGLCRSKSSRGQRKLSAIFKLADRGLLTITKNDRHNGVPQGGFVRTYFAEVLFCLGS